MNSKIRKQLERSVLRGVKLLDKRDPQWWNGGGRHKAVVDGMVGHINLRDFDMSSGAVCVLGQRHEDQFTAGTRALGLGDSLARHAEYGFELSEEQREDGYSENFSLLTELWAAVIRARRNRKSKLNANPFVVIANKGWRRTRAQKGDNR